MEDVLSLLQAAWDEKLRQHNALVKSLKRQHDTTHKTHTQAVQDAQDAHAQAIQERDDAQDALDDLKKTHHAEMETRLRRATVDAQNAVKASLELVRARAAARASVLKPKSCCYELALLRVHGGMA